MLSSEFYLLLLGHFELIFVQYMVWGRGSNNSFVCGYPVVPAPFVEKTVFPSIDWSWHSSQKSVGHRCMALFLDSQLYFIYLYVYPLTSTTLSWLLLLLNHFDVISFPRWNILQSFILVPKFHSDAALVFVFLHLFRELQHWKPVPFSPAKCSGITCSDFLPCIFSILFVEHGCQTSWTNLILF